MTKAWNIAKKRVLGETELGERNPFCCTRAWKYVCSISRSPEVEKSEPDETRLQEGLEP